MTEPSDDARESEDTETANDGAQSEAAQADDASSGDDDQDETEAGLTGRLRHFRERIKNPVLRTLYSTVVILLGLALIVAGIIMLVIPGPGIVSILLGLAVLGTEFTPIRRFTTAIRNWIKRTWRKARNTDGDEKAS